MQSKDCGFFRFVLRKKRDEVCETKDAIQSNWPVRCGIMMNPSALIQQPRLGGDMGGKRNAKRQRNAILEQATNTFSGRVSGRGLFA